jgi:hypothetical protein
VTAYKIWQLLISACNLRMAWVVAHGPLNIQSPNVMKTDEMSETVASIFNVRKLLKENWTLDVTRQDLLEQWSQIGNFPKNVKLKTWGNWTDCITFWSRFLCIMLMT